MKRLMILVAMALVSCSTAPTGTPVPVQPPVEHYYKPRYSDQDFLTPMRRQVFNNLRIYEVMVESFVDGDPQVGMGQGYGTSHHQGDLKGIIQSLDYIKSLGFNALWITPFFAVGGNSRLDATGYYPQDYFSVDPNFGTLEDARTLVRKAHEKGLYVFLDGVFGHNKPGVKPSPSGLLPTVKRKGSNGVSVFYDQQGVHQNTVDFFIEVATWWIHELEIDGWRMDVAYELKQGRHIFWQEIREAVQDLCLDREAQGKTWGTLGFLVAETWKSAGEINALTFGRGSNKGLLDAFDFPLRSELMKVLATTEGEEGADLLGDAFHLSQAFRTREQAPPWGNFTLMIGNHDLVRFGDLIQRSEGLGYGPEHPDYWKRHKLAFSFQAAVTGPIMNYYGEEIGDQVGAYAGGLDFIKRVPHTAATPAADWGVAEDHVARTSGRIEGVNTSLNSREKDLKAYLRDLLEMRAAYPALYNGTRTPLTQGEGLYADLKSDNGERVLYVANLGTRDLEFQLELGCSGAEPLGPGAVPVRVNEGQLAGKLPALSAAFYLIR